MANRDWVDDATEDLPQLVTAREATSLLRCSRRTLSREIDRGKLEVVRQSDGCSRVLIPREVLRHYLRGLGR